MSQKTYQRISKVLDWLVYMLGYTIVLIAVSVLFKKTVYIDNSLFGLWGFIAVIIIYILNKTIKPLVNASSNRINTRFVLSVYQCFYFKNSRIYSQWSFCNSRYLDGIYRCYFYICNEWLNGYSYHRTIN